MPWPLDTPHFEDRFTRIQAALADRYRLERELGPVGAVSAYQARDLAADRPVVLKLFDPSRTRAVGAARLLRRLRTAGRIQHGHLLPLLDSGLLEDTDGDTVYYAVPLLAGETLRARLDRDLRLPVLEALAIAQDVAAALAAAHAQGVAHGAVSAESVVLAGGQAYLADFGMAVGDAEPAPTDDLAALGGVLYEMLSGAPVPEGNPPLLRAGRAGVPEELELTVARLLSPLPRGYASADEVRTALTGSEEAARALTLPGGTAGEPPALRRPIPARWTVFTFAVLGLFGLSLWLRYDAPELAPPPPVPVRPRSLAVIPFLTASPDSGAHDVGEGLSHALAARLGRIPGLRVSGAGSTARLDLPRLNPRRAGQRLGVDAVLFGTVRPGGGRIRLRVRLLSVGEGFDLWSETYDRESGQLDGIARDLVGAVAGALRLLPPPDPAGLPSLPAQSPYLRGLDAAARGRHRSAVPLLEESIALDSTYAPAWAALGDVWLRAGADDGIRPTDAATRAREAAVRALALDSLSATAHAVLGGVQFFHDWNWAAAEGSLRRSIALDPSLPEARLRLAHLLLATGRADEATDEGREAVVLSPLDPQVRLELARHWLHLGDQVRAGEEAARAAALAPGDAGADLVGGIVAAVAGRYEAALEPLQRAAVDSLRGEEARATLGWAYALGGRRAEARAVQTELLRTAAARYVSPYHLAYLAEVLGDRRAAFAALEAAVAARAPELADLRVDARLDRLRADRRFDALARRVGLP